eukprot:SM000207S06177  [mRNA]  locus=s207:84882:87502:+ [translate_table: standard]
MQLTGFSNRGGVKGLTAAGNNREQKVVAAIEAWNRPLHPDLRREKYAKMSAGPFALFRGTVHLFWGDFSGDWRLCRFGNPRTRTWLLGDMHIYNFGAFYNENSQLVYGLNDFDESLIGDYQYDLWRLAVSIVLCARENGDPDVGEEELERIVTACAQSYLSTLVTYERTPEGRVFDAKRTRSKLKQMLGIVEDKESPAKLLSKCVRGGDGEIVGFNYELTEKLVPCSDEEKTAIRDAFPMYYQNQRTNKVDQHSRAEHGHEAANNGDNGAAADHWRILDVARRISSGLGSLGVPRYYVLVDVGAEHVILDVKRQTKPAAYYFLSSMEQWEYGEMFANDALRHAEAAYALTAFTDKYNGWLKARKPLVRLTVRRPGPACCSAARALSDSFFSVRQRSPYKQAYPAMKAEAKGAFKGLVLDSEKRWTGMAEQWGAILATEHAHARHDFDGAVDKLTKHHVDEFSHVVWQVARDYGYQVDTDWRYFRSTLTPDDC